MIKTFLGILFLASCSATQAQDPLEEYVKRLKQSEASGGSETAFLSVGSTFLYGQGYFEKKQFDLANMYFKQAYQKDSTNAFVNYQLASSLLKQNDPHKSKEAEMYLQNALRLNPGLRYTYKKEFGQQEPGRTDVPKGITAKKKYEEPKIVRAPVEVKTDVLKKLVFGNYVCTETVWNGPNASPAYKYIEKGYFKLNNDGSYRWLDNGSTGKYTFNEKTGEIKWLSGHLASLKPQSSKFERGQKVSQINIKFLKDYSWECGCNNK